MTIAKSVLYGAAAGATMLLSACGLDDGRSTGLCRKGGIQIEDLYARIEIYRVLGIGIYEGSDSKKQVVSGPRIRYLKDLVLKKSIFSNKGEEEKNNGYDYYDMNVLTYEYTPDKSHLIFIMIDENCRAEIAMQDIDEI